MSQAETLNHPLRAIARPGWLRRRLERLRLFEPRFGEAATTRPEVIRLEAEDGAAKASPVRIFLGTTPAEWRALRVLFWSIRALRDPARSYELHVMANLARFPRRRWRTAYQGYRAAVPALAGGAGRAIYCETGTVFLEDPARLLDLDMGGAGWLAAPDGRLALLDCATLAPLWPAGELEDGTPPDRIEARARRGALPADWARGAEGAQGATGAALLPANAAPQAGSAPLARLWQDRERAADAAGFLPFTKDRASHEFGELIGLYRQMHDAQFFPGQRLKHHLAPVRELVAATGAETLLDYGAGKAEGYARIAGAPDDSPLRHTPAWPGVTVRCYDPGVETFADPGAEPVDGVISTDVVEHLCPWDVAWVLDDMFARARGFVFVVAACYPAVKRLPDGRNPHTTLQSHDWWRDQMRLAARRHPGIAWCLGCDDRGPLRKTTTLYRD
ncbi:hypothetical protein DDZ14_00055 [Maritimibacter sp. 55A14]|uniref:hypothetical protein n=1 Tax=Maritimibacter sp. 55A14 TaxID=2174844 RepID=UPI000D614ED1|nr:hypothetical protein [Maritimibacter sp. 55A14]PWE34151.1 hypothetical protein DDZ14_00055 [Maritimibacter sp. 55A14]